MALQASQVVVQAGITPAAITPSSSDTIADVSFGPNGVVMRVITTGTATNVAVQDPGVTPGLGNPGTVTAVAAPATGVRLIFIPRGALSNGVATVTFSGALTGVTYELYRW